MTNPWFRMYTEAVDDEKLRLLAFEDRWHFVALLCCKGKGILDEGEVGMVRRKVAVKLGLDLRELDEVARRLNEVGLIDATTLQPRAWSDRQFQSDSSTERVRAYRERRKRNGNVSVTAQEADTDTDTEKTLSLPSGSDCGSGKPTHPPYQRIVDLYHSKLPMLRGVAKLSAARKQAIRGRWSDGLPDLDAWSEYFDIVAESSFLTGKAPPNGRRKPWQADFDWLIKETNTLKVFEGRYDD